MQAQTLEQFIDSVMEREGWCTTEQMAKEALDAGVFTEEFEQNARIIAAKDRIRRALRRRDANNVPLYANVMQELFDGEQVRAYKIEALFNIDDYHLVISDLCKGANQLVNVALGYQERAQKRFSVQIPLPLEAFGRDATN